MQKGNMLQGTSYISLVLNGETLQKSSIFERPVTLRMSDKYFLIFGGLSQNTVHSGKYEKPLLPASIIDCINNFNNSLTNSSNTNSIANNSNTNSSIVNNTLINNSITNNSNSITNTSVDSDILNSISSSSTNVECSSSSNIINITNNSINII